ncbi:MAG: GIY-YIG nuclease family protein [Terriglobales bacterium]
MVREYRFYVYILQSSSRRALYIGMTNNLRQRVFDHKAHRHEGFTDQYNAVRLVHWERYDDVHKAIAREKQLKRWRREKKLWLIARFNPGWKNLAADWFDNTPAEHLEPRDAALEAKEDEGPTQGEGLTQGPSTCPRIRSERRSG